MAENGKRKAEYNTEHPNIKARVKPHNAEAEQAVLGCVLLDEEAALKVLTELKEDDFYIPAHAAVFTAMRAIFARNTPVDFVTLVGELEALGLMEQVGGVSYVSKLTNAVPTASNYRYYLDLIRKNSQLRKLIAAGEKIIDCAYTGDPDDGAMSLAEREIYALAEKGDSGSFVGMPTATGEVIDKLEALCRDPKASRGITTGFAGLNRYLNGLQRSDLILIAARPGEGKTSIGMNMVRIAALSAERKTETGAPDPYVCAVFSLEMPYTQLAKRMLCSEALVDMTHCNEGNLTAEEWRRLIDAKARLDKSKIFIYDSSNMSPMEIVSRCRRLKREHGLDLVMIDYLQLMTMGGRVESRQQEVAAITRMMKIAARELDVPILLLSQMSRAIDSRKDGRPQMSDLRESGAIEQDADIILFIHRPNKNNESLPEEERAKVELIIAKHRNGETGTVELKWQGPFVRFVDVDNSARTRAAEAAAPPEQSGGTFVIDTDAPADAPFDTGPAGYTPSDDGPADFSASTVDEILKVDPNDDSDDIL